MQIKSNFFPLDRIAMQLLSALSILVGIFSCQNSDTRTDLQINQEPMVISTAGIDATGPYFTTDHEGHPVLVWNEKLAGNDQAGYVVRFAKFSRNGQEILSNREVTPSRGCSTSGESMSKIAFRNDGSMVAVFSRRKPSDENRFAGALYYSQSFDDGQTWSPERYLHVGDTTAGLSRSFFDIATLPDGEIGAIWLDSRLKSAETEGSTLFFAKTQGAEGFVSDHPIGYETCECCRTELFVAESGDIHVLFRKIWQDSIRDIAHMVSENGGSSFSEPVRISRDNWVIYGCPHTGPSMTETSDGLEITWFTMGGEPGLYRTKYDPVSREYSVKELLSYDGRHPQVVTSGTHTSVYLWEASAQTDSHGGHMGHSEPAATISLHDMTEPESVLMAHIRNRGETTGEIEVTGNGGYMEFPVGLGLENHVVGMAWVERDKEGKQRVLYHRLMISGS